MSFDKIVSFLIFTVVLSCLISESSADTGKAMWYKPVVPTACFGKVNQGQWVAAISEDLWKLGKYKCGQILTISCAGGQYPCKAGSKSIEVKIVDHWVAPDVKFIAISKQAFSSIADPLAGQIPIQFY
ncbi:hypothetical protein ACET3Z_024583 [Daucus carota]